MLRQVRYDPIQLLCPAASPSIGHDLPGSSCVRARRHAVAILAMFDIFYRQTLSLLYIKGGQVALFVASFGLKVAKVAKRASGPTGPRLASFACNVHCSPPGKDHSQ